jgi:hypothetical protein
MKRSQSQPTWSGFHPQTVGASLFYKGEATSSSNSTQYPSQAGGIEMQRSASFSHQRPTPLDSTFNPPAQSDLHATSFDFTQQFTPPHIQHQFRIMTPWSVTGWNYANVEAYHPSYNTYLSPPAWSVPDLEADMSAPAMSRDPSSSSFSTSTSHSLGQPDMASQEWLPPSSYSLGHACVEQQQASISTPYIWSDQDHNNDVEFDFKPRPTPVIKEPPMMPQEPWPMTPEHRVSERRAKKNRLNIPASQPNRKTSSHTTQPSTRRAKSPRPKRESQVSKDTLSATPISRIKSSDGRYKLEIPPSNLGTRKPEMKNKLRCEDCNERPDGFRGQHELDRHRNRKHANRRAVWICIDGSSSAAAYSELVKLPLKDCKYCLEQKRYGAYYNAAAQ